MTEEIKTVENGFADSITKITRDNIVPLSKLPKKNGRQKLSDIVRIVIMLACLSVFVFCIYTIAQNLLDYAEAQNYYDKLAQIWGNDDAYSLNSGGDLAYSQKDYSSLGENKIYSDDSINDNSQTTVTPVPADSDEMTRIKAKLGALYRQNSDLIAWISIPDTVIDYPVVKTDNNDYYLNHSFNGDYLLAGTIFADYRNSKNLLNNYNTVIYGHNLNLSSGTMFSILSNYFKKSYLEEHPDIYIYTTSGIYIYRIFNVAKVKATSGYIRTYFASGDDFVEFANSMASKSVHKDETLEFTESDRLLTLSTCTNEHFASERYCIQARLIEIRQ